jgi:diguanylate cyclase (GGDEF)-like protein/PAS domain S-box-containing protein
MSYDLPIKHIIRPDMLECAPHTSVLDAAKLMSAANCSSILVSDRGQIVGIWTESDALTADFSDSAAFSRPVSRVMSSPVLTLHFMSTIGETAQLFIEMEVRHFLVVDDAGMYLGIVTQTDVIQNSGVELSVRLKILKSLVRHVPLVVSSATLLSVAIKKMKDARLDAVVVDFGDELGILTGKDVVRLIGDGHADLRVAEIATRPLICMDENASLHFVLNIFTDKGMRHLGVIGAAGILNGLVCYADILASIEHDYVAELRTALKEYEYKLILAEKVQRENESRLKDMFENLSSGVAIFQASEDGRSFVISALNRAAERIENMRREDVIGKSVENVFPGITEFGLLEVLRRVWANGVAEQFPVSFYHEGHVVGCRENYVYKLPNGEVVSIYDDVTKEKQAEEQMHLLAHYDPLTGLPNRTLFTDRLQQALVVAKRDKLHIALMFLDLDKFKPVNDELGHDMGDLLLKAVAQLLQSCVRASDTVSRIGGDEFVILLAGIESAQDAMRVAEKILHALIQPLQLPGHHIQISASIGIAVYPEHGGDEKTLIKHADTAMYTVKNNGRNSARLYHPD